MKKFLALILLVTTCFSLSSCFLLDLIGGGNDFDYKGDWDVIAYDSARDTLQNQAASVRPDDDVLGDLVTIDASSISYTISTGARTKDMQFIEDEITAVYEGQAYDNRRTMFGPLTAFGETMMLWNGPDTGEARNVLLRRSDVENYDPVSSLISYNNYEMSYSLDALIGDYESKLVKINAGYTNAKAFSTRDGHNGISITKEDDTYKFTEEDKTWTVTNVIANAFLRGVQIEMTSGEDTMMITVLEVGEDAVCYALNRTDKGELGGQYVTNYGILIKK